MCLTWTARISTRSRKRFCKILLIVFSHTSKSRSTSLQRYWTNVSRTTCTHVNYSFIMFLLSNRTVQKSLIRFNFLVNMNTTVGFTLANRLHVRDLRGEYGKWASPQNRNAPAPVSNEESVMTSTSTTFNILLSIPKPTNPQPVLELDRYLDEMPEEFSDTFCPLNFWSCSMSRFPTLALMARKYLAIPASSAGIERFSL